MSTVITHKCGRARIHVGSCKRQRRTLTNCPECDVIEHHAGVQSREEKRRPVHGCRNGGVTRRTARIGMERGGLPEPCNLAGFHAGLLRPEVWRMWGAVGTRENCKRTKMDRNDSIECNRFCARAEQNDSPFSAFRRRFPDEISGHLNDRYGVKNQLNPR